MKHMNRYALTLASAAASAALICGNVAAQERDPGSMLNLTRALLRLRRAEPALAAGAWRPVAGEGTLLAYERHDGDSRLLVALNFGAEAVALPAAAQGAQRLLSTLTQEASSMLRGNEGVVMRLSR